MTTEIIWSDCRSCKRNTKQSALGEKIIRSHSEGYHDETKYYLLECNGCGTISFRKEYHDYETYYQTGEDEFTHDITIETFPHYIKDHISIESQSGLPSIVGSIYRESLLAVQEGAFTLAGLGLRATIEAICNDKNVIGKNLLVRISAMHKSGMVSKSDAERLHAIRFMGNDAAHEIKKAKEKSVLIALKIIEHILLSIYIFEEEVNRHLETPISNIDEALPILKSNLLNIEEGSTFTLTKWLGSSHRRVLDKLDLIESGLKSQIENNFIEGVELSVKPESEESTSQWYRKVAVSVPA